jgi:hypothetical protein
MKFAVPSLLLALFGSATAFTPAPSVKKSTSLNAFVAKELPGVLSPVGFFHPLRFAKKVDEPTMKNYCKPKLTHGHVAILATVGFLVGEKVEQSSFLFDCQISRPATTHIYQVPAIFE